MNCYKMLVAMMAFASMSAAAVEVRQDCADQIQTAIAAAGSSYEYSTDGTTIQVSAQDRSAVTIKNAWVIKQTRNSVGGYDDTIKADVASSTSALAGLVTFTASRGGCFIENLTLNSVN